MKLNDKYLFGSERRLRMIYLILGLIVISFPLTESRATTLTDTAGDAFDGSPFSDFLAMEVSETAIDLTFRLRFSNLSQGSNGCILLDTDGDRTTRGTPFGTVSEFTIEFTVSILGICTAQLFHGSTATYLSCWVSNNDFFIKAAKSMLPSDLSALEVAAVSASDFLCSGRDRIPDSGYWIPRTGAIHIANEGISLSPLSSLTDSATDQGAPINLKGIEVEQQGEHLKFRVQYHHPIEPHDISAVGWNSIYLDLDKDILTGFQNTSEVYPTFGIDAAVQFAIYPWTLGGATDANLYVENPSKPTQVSPIQIGKFGTDSAFRRVGNYVEFYIPLALLPTVTKDTVIMLDALAPVAGKLDRYPDTGAITLSTAGKVPVQTCRTGKYTISDPSGDSFGFGSDNDDLIQVSACQSQDATLFTIHYHRLDMIGEALTALRMDIDSNNKTGEILPNFANNTQLGIEKTIVYQFSSTSGGPPVARDVGGEIKFFGGTSGGSPSFLSIVVNGASGDLIRGINALVTVWLGKIEIYVTVPHRMYSDDGAMNVHVATMSTAYGTAVFADEAPNSGVLTIPVGATPPIPQPGGPVNISPLIQLLLKGAGQH